MVIPICAYNLLPLTLKSALITGKQLLLVHISRRGGHHHGLSVLIKCLWPQPPPSSEQGRRTRLLKYCRLAADAFYTGIAECQCCFLLLLLLFLTSNSKSIGGSRLDSQLPLSESRSVGRRWRLLLLEERALAALRRFVSGRHRDRRAFFVRGLRRGTFGTTVVL